MGERAAAFEPVANSCRTYKLAGQRDGGDPGLARINFREGHSGEHRVGEGGQRTTVYKPRAVGVMGFGAKATDQSVLILVEIVGSYMHLERLIRVLHPESRWWRIIDVVHVHVPEKEVGIV